MGGGRSGLFLGTAGADVYQESLFLEPVDVRRRGATYLPNVESAIVGGATIGGQSKDKLYVLTIKEILKKFMDYRFGRVSESKLVHWLQTVLSNRHYYIESSLRHILTKGLIALKATKAASQSYDRQNFLVELERIESEMLSE